jgi:dihydrofolate synthase/folylpolyglutamate synthase
MALAAFQTRGWRLGLDRMNAFVDELGLRDYVTGASRPMYFHVAGTNGKGSTTCFLQHLLHEHGYRVGACYSPYVYDVRERVQIGLDLISKDEFAACAEILMAAGEVLEKTEFGGPTEFEMKIAMGFLAWQRAGVNAVALETGMGGRLDATNVVDPACSVITTIGLDHVEHLGPTLGDIAREKAGIIKPGRPVVVGNVEPVAAEVIEGVAKDLNSPCLRLGREIVLGEDRISGPDYVFGGLVTGLRGSFQLFNAALAIGGLEAAGVCLDPERVRSSLLNAKLPGRMQMVEIRGQKLLLDGAHNAQAAATLEKELRGQTYTLIWGMTTGHSPVEFLQELKDIVTSVVILPAKAAGERAAPASDLSFACKALGIKHVVADDASEAIRLAQKLPETNILVSGSFYLLYAFRA